MLKIYGLIVNPGIAYGKALVLMRGQELSATTNKETDQLAVLESALSKSASRLEEQIKTSHMLYSDRISTIFEAHKLMISDPMILDKAKSLISFGDSAYDAYRKSAEDAITMFSKLPSDYMRNRTIDIEDATDRVLYAIQEENYEISCSFEEAKILILEKMKPSVLYNFTKECVFGFISKTGSYNQHSAVIARTKDIPGMIVEDIFDFNILDGDMILINAYTGEAYINPDIDLVNKTLEERR